MKVRIVVVWLLAAAIALAILHFGMIHFGGMDGSAALQAAWRYTLGHTPYEDYRSVAPVAYLVPSGVAFELFGVRWRSLVILTALFAALTFVWQDALLRRAGLPDRWSLLVALLTQALTTIPLGWWSYNQTTAVAGALFASAAFAFVAAPQSRGAFVSLVASMAILSWMKPNVAGILLAGVAIVLLIGRRTRGRFVIAAAAAIVLSVGALLLSGVNPLRMIASYLGAGGRVLDGETFMNYFYWAREAFWTLQFLAAGLLAVFVRLLGTAHDGERRGWMPVAISIVCIAAGLIGMGTNNEFNSVDAPVVATALAILAMTGTAPRERVPRVATVILLAFGLGGLTLLGLRFTVTRERIRTIGPSMFHEPGPVTRLTDPPLFAGMAVGPRLRSTVAEIKRVLRENPHGATDVFFGPRMEFGYPAWRLVPAKGMSLWWTGTGEAGPEDEEAVRQAFVRWNPRLCIFLENDFTYVSPGVRKFLDSEYTRSDSGNLTVYVRRNRSRP